LVHEAAKWVELSNTWSFFHGRSNELIIYIVMWVESSLETMLCQLGGVIKQTKLIVGGVTSTPMIVG